MVKLYFLLNFLILFFPFICSASENIGFKKIHYDKRDSRPIDIASGILLTITMALYS